MSPPDLQMQQNSAHGFQCNVTVWWDGQGLGTGDMEKRTSLACLAAYHGQTDCLRVFDAFQLRITGSICMHAAAAGHLPCLRLAHQLGDYLTTHSAMRASVQGGFRR
jgi:hypothetical protein